MRKIWLVVTFLLQAALVAYAVDMTRAVGSIPMQESVSPSGARLYSIPIETSAYSDYSPQISLQYNSQCGSGVAGYGWNIAGLSAITLTGKTQYYDGEFTCPAVSSGNSVYSLDGDRLVPNDLSGTDPAYTLISARGKVLVKVLTNSSGAVTHFHALYPDGSSAVYGKSGNSPWEGTFPVTERTDACGNVIRYTYHNVYPNDTYLIQKIEYGFQSPETPRADILFSYDDESGNCRKYYAGRWSQREKRLRSITTRSNGEELRTYTLTHSPDSGEFLVSRIDCSVGTDTLNPLLFNYRRDEEDYSFTDDFLTPVTIHNLPDLVSDATLVNKRCKLKPDVYDDGLVIYPNRPKYKRKQIRPERWGSGYSDSDKVIIIPRLSDYSSEYYLMVCDSGFQTVEPADIDGDGTDELVRVGFSSCLGDSTILNLFVYRYSYEQHAMVLDSSGAVSVYGTVTTEQNTKSPLQFEYFFGDFRGIGRAELMVLSTNKDFKGGERDSRATVIDLLNFTKIIASSCFGFNAEEEYTAFAADIDGDIVTELYLPEENGTKKAVWDNGTASIQKGTSLFGPKREDFEREGGVLFGDFNSDGLTDMFRRPFVSGSNYGLFLNTGTGFTLQESRMVMPAENARYVAANLNKDGYCDIVVVNGHFIELYINDRGALPEILRPSSKMVQSVKGFVGGSLSHLQRDYELFIIDGSELKAYPFGRDFREGRLLTLAVESSGAEHYSTYADITRSPAVYYPDYERTYTTASGYHRAVFPLNVVSSTQSYIRDASGEDLTLVEMGSYIYRDLVVNTRGLGFCGFGKLSQMDNLRNVLTETVSNPEMCGVPTSVKTRLGYSGSIIDSTVFTYTPNVHRYRKMNPLLTGKQSFDRLKGISSFVSFQYDSLDFHTACFETAMESSSSDSSYLVETINAYSHVMSPSRYRLGILSHQSVIRTTLPQEEQFCTWTGWAYNDAGQPIHIEEWTGFPDSGEVYPTDLLSTTIMSYDSAGRLTMKKSAPRGSQVFVGDEYGYSSSTGLLDNSWDEYGRWTEYMSCDKYGNPAWIWNENECWRTDFTYDAWGRKTSTTRHDGTRDSTSVSWSDIALYKVRTKNAGEPETVTHYDALGRVVRQSDRRFDGTWRHVDTQYNSKGQLWRVSLPHKGTPSQWTTYAYDEFGRQISVTTPNGRVDTTIYAGRRTTKAISGVTRTTLVDAAGQVKKVTDAAGTVTMEYRPDGQLNSSTAPGGAVTTFTYDNTGRRTGMNSPGAGVHSWSFALDTQTGSETQTHVSPEGTVVTTYDYHGRPTQRVNQGDFTTNWTYWDRNLVWHEVSSNGTRRDYDYDEDWRVTGIKDTGLDGKWLKQVFTYDDGDAPEGNLLSTLLVCDTDTLGTERYYYSDGYNVVTSFLPANAASPSDSILVWRLTAENDLGLPTAGQSAGGISRTYSYDSYGRPMRRTLGSAMDFGYAYNINDNLSSRSDYTRTLTETFTYDALDRLVSVSGPGSGAGSSIGTRSRVYVPNGNVSSDTKVGTYTYGDPGNPYRQTALDLYKEEVPQWDYTLKMNSFSRPDSLRWNQDYYYTTDLAQFDYDASGNLVYSWTGFSGCDYPENEHFYLGGRFETERWLDWSNEDILYLGGDAMTAPVVLKRYWISDEDDPEEAEWTVYNIGRDNLGSVTHIVSPAGTKVAEASYDAWGRTRSVSNWDLYEYSDPQTLLYRGYAGYPFLQTLGLYHASARIYDPLTGRFLGYDPVVQNPNNSQNWNSYAYCLNNPFRYTDPDGRIWNYIIGSALGGISNWIVNGCEFSWRGLGYFGVGALSGALSILGGSAISSIIGLYGVIGGSASGAISGIISGFTTGSGNTWLNGGSFCDGIISGFSSATASGITGGLVGGISGGVSAIRHGGNIWTGDGMTFDSIISQNQDIGDIEIGEGMEYSNNYAKSFSDDYFGTNVKGVGELYSDGSLPNGYVESNGHVYNNKGTEVAGSAVFHKGGKTDIYLYKSAYIAKEELYLTMGHEYLHAGFNDLGLAGYHRMQHIGIGKWEYAQAEVWNYRLDFYKARYDIVKDLLGFDYTKVGFYVIPVNIF